MIFNSILGLCVTALSLVSVCEKKEKEGNETLLDAPRPGTLAPGHTLEAEDVQGWIMGKDNAKAHRHRGRKEGSKKKKECETRG